jgi:AhpD family alkylhydroperoxidase
MTMDNRIKELIAVGASVTANCQPCLQYHVSKALESGANEEEIIEAISVAKMVRKGAMGKMDQFVSTVFKTAEVAAGASEKGCGCS